MSSSGGPTAHMVPRSSLQIVQGTLQTDPRKPADRPTDGCIALACTDRVCSWALCASDAKEIVGASVSTTGILTWSCVPCHRVLVSTTGVLMQSCLLCHCDSCAAARLVPVACLAFPILAFPTLRMHRILARRPEILWPCAIRTSIWQSFDFW